MIMIILLLERASSVVEFVINCVLLPMSQCTAEYFCYNSFTVTSPLFYRQLDIGLERYGPTQLFVRLATPTFFVIVTVIQLHYFHNDFINLSRTGEQPIVAPTSEEGSSVQGRVLEQHDDDTDKSNLSSLKIDLTDLQSTQLFNPFFFLFICLYDINRSVFVFSLSDVSTMHIKYKVNELAMKIAKLVDFVFVFFEIHMHKFVLLIALLMCIYDSCALYYIVLFFVVLSVTTSRKMQLFVIYSTSIFISLILLARMVYQIQYIKHDTWKVTCNVSNFNVQRFFFFFFFTVCLLVYCMSLT